jgi:hypothetical protein
MTLFIAHRGNTNGPNCMMENTPDHIMSALDKGYDVEIDLWYASNSLWLGHDKPEWKIGASFIYLPGLWIHAKNIEALQWLNARNDGPSLNYFWHQTDDYTLTSKGFIWCYPNRPVRDMPGTKSVAVMPSPMLGLDLSSFTYICDDYADRY